MAVANVEPDSFGPLHAAVRNDQRIHIDLVAVVLFGIALHPSLSFLALGVDGPARVGFFTAGTLWANRFSLAVQPRRYWWIGVAAVAVFLSFMILSVALSIDRGTSPAEGLWNLVAFATMIGFAALSRGGGFSRVIRSVQHSLVLGGVLTSVYVFLLSARHGRFLVGLLRYELVDFNLNHYATYTGLALVGAFGLGSNVEGGRNSMLVRLAIVPMLLAFVMLFSRASVLGLLGALFVMVLRRYYRTLTVLAILAVVALGYLVLHYAEIYSTYALAIDFATSGRGRLWYYVSDFGRFPVVSDVFERDDLFVERTAGSGHDTSYVHSTFIYLLVNVGLVGTLAFLAAVLVAFYRSLKRGVTGGPWVVGMLVYLVILGAGEQPLEFQKYGTIYVFLLAGLGLRRSWATGPVPVRLPRSAVQTGSY